MVGLIITGLLMGKKAQLAGDYTGFLSFGTEYSTLLSIKHLLYFLMVGLAIFRSLIVDKLKKPSHEVKMKLNIITLIVNVIAGLAVLLLSANTAVLAAMP
jgi:putative copper export protein